MSHRPYPPSPATVLERRATVTLTPLAVALIELLRALPMPPSTTPARADWHDGKARVLQAIADHSAVPFGRGTAADLARDARTEAARLRGLSHTDGAA